MEPEICSWQLSAIFALARSLFLNSAFPVSRTGSASAGRLAGVAPSRLPGGGCEDATRLLRLRDACLRRLYFWLAAGRDSDRQRTDDAEDHRHYVAAR